MVGRCYVVRRLKIQSHQLSKEEHETKFGFGKVLDETLCKLDYGTEGIASIF